jgi:hypothetical protein
MSSVGKRRIRTYAPFSGRQIAVGKMAESESNAISRPGGLNEFQAARLRVACQYVDRLLSEIEVILNAPESKSPFPRYIADVELAQRQTIEEYIAQVRTRLVGVLEDENIDPPQASIPALRAIRATLSAVDIAAEEMKPQYMRGYGDVSGDVATYLNELSAELRSLSEGLDHCLVRPGRHDSPPQSKAT